MIFVTAGSMLPFDRLFRIVDTAIDEGIVTSRVYGQIGEGLYEPRNFDYVRFLDKEDFDNYVRDAELVIGHAGIGVIMQALEFKVPLLVLARKAKLGEHVNDHQVATARKFEELEHVLSFEEENLAFKLMQVKDFIPKPRTPNISGVGKRVAEFISANRRR